MSLHEYNLQAQRDLNSLIHLLWRHLNKIRNLKVVCCDPRCSNDDYNNNITFDSRKTIIEPRVH